MVEVSAARLALVVYHSVAAVVALVLLAEFFRKRNDFFLKTRFPHAALVMQVACISGWVSQGVIQPFFPAADCYIIVVYQGTVATVVLLSHVARGWGLYWRVFLMQHLARSRALLKQEVENSRTWFSPQSVFTDTDDEVSHEHSRLQIFTYRVLRYAVLGYFGALLLFHAISVQVEYAMHTCGIFPLVPGTLMVIFTSFMLAAAVLRKAIGSFRDNANVYVELRRTAIAYLVIFSYFLGVVVYVTVAGRGQDGKNWIPLMEALPFYVQVFFVICNVFPLKDQHELDRKVQMYDISDKMTLDDVLADPVSHTALKNFMRREFCDEMLEFHDAVSEYQSMHDMWSREKRGRRARIIFVQFVQPGAPSQINVSDGVVKGITSHLGQLLRKKSGATTTPTMLSDKADTPKDVFDAAKRSIGKLILSGPFLRFQVHGGGVSVRHSRDGKRGSCNSKRGSYTLTIPEAQRDQKDRTRKTSAVSIPAEA